jgi:sugar lactone lactonase YvrE
MVKTMLKYRLKILLSLVALFANSKLSAQHVKSLFQHNQIADGLYVSRDGKVFTTCGGLVQKNSIGIYDPENKDFALISSEMRGSIDIASNDDQILFVTNYDDNSVKSFNRKTGKTSTVATDLDGPAGIEIDKKGNLYVTSFGTPPAYKGNSVWKITPEGDKQLVIQSDELFRPQGIGWFDQNTLIVSNSSGGKLFLLDVEKRELKPFAMTGQSHGNIAIARDLIFLACPQGHKILVLNRQGQLISTYGMDKPETKDGSLETSYFVSPQGLAFSHDEQILYVSQIANGILRSIVFNK